MTEKRKKKESGEMGANKDKFKAALLELLQENLTVEVSKDHPYDPFDDLNAESTVTVQILFDGKVIAESRT